MQKQVEVSRADAPGGYMCVATFLPVRRWRDLIPFLAMSRRVEEQLKHTPGLVRYGLKTNFLRRRFWTFSVWRDRGAMARFVPAEPHATAVGRFKEWAGPGAAFAEWQSRDGSINWTETLNRLKTPTFYYGASET